LGFKDDAVEERITKEVRIEAEYERFAPDTAEALPLEAI
jgi:hypothetical protein